LSYRLDLYPFVEDPAREQPIIETVMRLPEDVREYVYEHCMFLWSDDFGRTWPGDLFAGKWVMVCNILSRNVIHQISEYAVCVRASFT
jgi:hypothetical protein